MTPLRPLQLRLCAAVLSPDAIAPADLAPPPSGDTASRFAIYHDGYRTRLIESLATDYPATRTLLGAPHFAEVARSFVEAHPSPYFSLRWYGSELADWIGSEDAVAAELAAFEWALADVFDAADREPTTVEEIAALPTAAWSGLRFTVHPSLRRLRMHWNAPEIWAAAIAGETLPVPISTGDYAAWIIWRKNLAVLYRRLAPDESTAFDRALAGATFSEVCEGLADHVSDAETPARAAVLLRCWVEEGLFAGLQRDG